MKHFLLSAFEFYELVNNVFDLINLISDINGLAESLDFSSFDVMTSDPSTDFMNALNQSANMKLKGR